MKRNVKYITEKGQIIELTEVVSDITNGLKIYLPYSYKVIYDGCCDAINFSLESFDFADDEYVRRYKPNIIKIINQNPSYATSWEDVDVMTARSRMSNIDKLMKLASTCFLVSIVFDNNGKLFNVHYQTFFEGLNVPQGIDLFDDMEYSRDYLILKEDEYNVHIQR